MTRILSEAAGSIDKLVAAVGQRKTEGRFTEARAEPDDDDWLFCKRLYKKLKNVQEGSMKDYLKHNIDSDVLRMIYNQSMNMYVDQPARQSEGSFLRAVNAVDECNSFGGSQYMQM